MARDIAALVFAFGILGLFWLARDRSARTSGGLWLPVIWLGIAASRAVTQWLAAFGLGPGVALTPDQYLEGSPLDRNVYLSLTVLGLIVLLRRQRKLGMLLRANGPLLLFFLYCAVSVVWSDYPDVALKRWIKALGDLVMVLIVLTELDPLAALKRLFSRVGFVLLPLSVLFIKYYPELGREYHPGVGAWAPAFTGVTTSKNLLGMVTLILGIGCGWCFLRVLRHQDGTRGRGPLIAYGIILATVVWLFWMANSATSTSAVLMAGGLLALTSLHRIGRKPAVVHLYIAAVVSLALFALFFNSGGGLLGTVGRDSTLTGRTDIWKLVLSMAGNPWVGTGFESFWLGDRLEKTWNVYRFHLQEAHNGYLDLYLNLGWIGILLLAFLLVTGYRSAVAAFRRDPNSGSLRLAYLLTAVTYNLTESAFKTQNPVWIFFLLAIITVPKALLRETTPPAPDNVDIHSLVESDPEVGQLADVGLRQEAF